MLPNTHGMTRKTCFRCIKRIFMRYVAMDETWIYHYAYTPESNRQSAEWTAKGDNRPKRPKTQISAGKGFGLRIGAFEERNCEKTTPNEEEKSALSPRQCTVSQVDRNNRKISRIALWITSSSTVFAGSGSQWLVPVCKPKKNSPGKKIWLQWRSDSRIWSVSWGQR